MTFKTAFPFALQREFHSFRPPTGSLVTPCVGECLKEWLVGYTVKLPVGEIREPVQETASLVCVYGIEKPVFETESTVCETESPV